VKVLLALDTSSDTPSMALAAHGGVFLWEPHPPLTLSESLLPALVQLLHQADGLRLEDLEGVVACTGPGIFTGIRVGLATLKGLLAPRPALPVWTINALEAWALQTPPETDGTIQVILDARREQIYTATYSWQESLLVERDAPRLCFSGDPNVARPTVAIGRFPEKTLSWLETVDPSPRLPEASSLLAPHLLKVPTCTARLPETSGRLLPLYLRPPDARPPSPPPFP